MIGHPDYKDMWKAASLQNPILDLTYMVISADIPDWVFACCGNEELDFSTLTAEQKRNFYNRSPMANVRNVITPAQFLIGDADLRVPPH
jgi:dipeptidyl aminopeptidase/acylaminoacyl peptidase